MVKEEVYALIHCAASSISAEKASAGEEVSDESERYSGSQPSVGVGVVVVVVEVEVVVLVAAVIVALVVVDAQSSEVSSMALHWGRRGRGFRAMRLVSRISKIRSPA